MPISLTNIMEWAGSGVAIIFAITLIIEVLIVGAITTLPGVLMVAGMAATVIGWQLEQRQSSAGSIAITAEAETLKT